MVVGDQIHKPQPHIASPRHPTFDPTHAETDVKPPANGRGAAGDRWGWRWRRWAGSRGAVPAQGGGRAVRPRRRVRHPDGGDVRLAKGDRRGGAGAATTVSYCSAVQCLTTCFVALVTDGRMVEEERLEEERLGWKAEGPVSCTLRNGIGKVYLVD